MPTFIKTGFWEKKAKGYKEWLDLDLLIQSIAGGGVTANNGLTISPANNVQLGGTLSQDTYIYGSGNNLLMQNFTYLILSSNNQTGLTIEDNVISTTGNSAVQSGLNCNYFTSVYSLGNWGSGGNYTKFLVDDANTVIKTQFTNQDIGLNLDFANNEYSFNSFNNTKFTLFDDFILTQYSGNNKGIKLDFSVNTYRFGDFDFSNNGTDIVIDDNNQRITTKDRGLYIDIGLQNYQLGDYNASGNATNIIVDDANQQIKFNNLGGLYNFRNVPTFASNVTALAGGLVTGDIYRVTGTGNMHIVF